MQRRFFCAALCGICEVATSGGGMWPAVRAVGSFFASSASLRLREQSVRHIRQLLQHQHWHYNNNKRAEYSKIVNVEFNHKNSCNI